MTRIVHTLHRQGMVWQRMVDGAYLPSHSLQQRAQADNADWLVEIASPVLEELCQKVSWPSVLTIPRLDYVEVIETNRPRAYFDDMGRRAQFDCDADSRRGDVLRLHQSDLED